MKRLYIIFLISLTPAFCSSQITFQSGFGDTATDNGTAIVETWYGGYCLVGSSGLNNTGASEIAVYFLNYLGELDQSYTYGLSGDDHPTGIVETADSGYLIVGTTKSSPLDPVNGDIFAMKIEDVNGGVIWAKVYGSSGIEDAMDIVRTPDNNYIIVGRTSGFGTATESGLVLKIDDNGDPVWCNVNSITTRNYLTQSDVTSTGEYIAGGGAYNGVDTDNYLVKLDANGNIVWGKKFGTAGEEWINDVKATSDQGYISVGETNNNTVGDYDQNVTKMDASGSVDWTFNYGATQFDRAAAILETDQQNYVVCGMSNLDPLGGTINQLILEQIDAAGNVIWSNSYGDSVLTFEGYNLIHGFAGGYGAVGFSVAFGDPNGDAVFIMTDSGGYSGCDEFPFPLTRGLTFFSESVGATGQLVTMPSTSINLFNIPFTNQYAQNCIFTGTGKINPGKKDYIKIYPNPANDFLFVENIYSNATINVYDPVGKLVMNMKADSAIQKIDLSTLDTGVYMITLVSKNNVGSAKFVKY